MNRKGNLVKKMNLNRFGVTDIIDRSGAEALISEQVANEIIQGVAEQSTVLRMGKKLPIKKYSLFSKLARKSVICLYKLPLKNVYIP